VNPIHKAFLLLCELGPAQLADNLVYRLQLKSGRFLKSTPAGGLKPYGKRLDFEEKELFAFDWVKTSPNLKSYLHQADEIVSGDYHPFGGNKKTFDFSIPRPLLHWTTYGDTLDSRDIKTFWEPARFTWTIPLCIGFVATGDESYSLAFWNHFERFLENNPVNMGPNWASAQEVALRVIPWTMAGKVFISSKHSSEERVRSLSETIWQSCLRIPPTLNYARSQNNNHWLSEALGLMLGGWLFNDTPEGNYWLKLGNQQFQSGILRTVDTAGTFSQHSTNYHRLLLHLGLLYSRIAKKSGLVVVPSCKDRLAQATKWLANQLDTASGRVPNLGHNDGSNLLPLGTADYADYRPTTQAASLAFLGFPYLKPGQWDELALSLGFSSTLVGKIAVNDLTSSAIHRVGNNELWASLRVPCFHSRPAHADLLHVEIWFNGENIAQDAGTYAYNLPDPWTNSLVKTCVHNTIVVDGQDQMYRAGKFLWLQRTKARLISQNDEVISASVRFKTPIAYTQRRTVTILPRNRIEVVDDIRIHGGGKSQNHVGIQWLLPDWDWQIEGKGISLNSKNKAVKVEISACESEDEITGEPSLVRSGENLFGKLENPLRGWVSTTYLCKTPALSYVVRFPIQKSLRLKSLWSLEKK
jgi:hypothetical protein